MMIVRYSHVIDRKTNKTSYNFGNMVHKFLPDCRKKSDYEGSVTWIIYFMISESVEITSFLSKRVDKESVSAPFFVNYSLQR